MKTRLTNHEIDIFTSYCPEIIDNTVGMYRTDDDRLVAKLKNGRFVVYDLVFGNSMWTDDPFKKFHPKTEEEFRKYFSKKLYREMYRRGVSQYDIAVRTGLTTAMISKYMNGLATPSAYKISLIAEALDCSVDELLDL